MPTQPSRNTGIDAYRGFVMLLMMAEVLHLSRVARAIPDSAFWQFLAYHQSHVEWAGCSLHDLIQPSFSFLVGVALPYSIASRMARGTPSSQMWWHTWRRAFLLVFLGVLLRWISSDWSRTTFEDTLAQIGLGYPLLFWLALKPPKWQWVGLGVILFGYWLAWALYPLSGGEPYQGFMAHWNKNANLGAAFEQWFLNLFPQKQPFVENRGGYLTLSFIPTLGTMILGLQAGRWLREAAPAIPFRRLLVAGAIGIASGLALHFLAICPVVKRIWTPSWTLFSGGACFLLLALFLWLTEVLGWKKALFPLIVIGMNSIAAYMLAHWIGYIPIRIGGAYGTLVSGAIYLLLQWIVLWWMYRRRLFVRL